MVVASSKKGQPVTADDLVRVIVIKCFFLFFLKVLGLKGRQMLLCRKKLTCRRSKIKFPAPAVIEGFLLQCGCHLIQRRCVCVDLGRDKDPVWCAVCQVETGTVGVMGEIRGGFCVKSMFMNQKNSKCILLAILFLRLPGVRKTLSRNKASCKFNYRQWNTFLWESVNAIKAKAFAEKCVFSVRQPLTRDTNI